MKNTIINFPKNFEKLKILIRIIYRLEKKICMRYLIVIIRILYFY